MLAKVDFIFKMLSGCTPEMSYPPTAAKAPELPYNSLFGSQQPLIELLGIAYVKRPLMPPKLGVPRCKFHLLTAPSS